MVKRNRKRSKYNATMVRFMKLRQHDFYMQRLGQNNRWRQLYRIHRQETHSIFGEMSPQFNQIVSGRVGSGQQFIYDYEAKHKGAHDQ